jgi:hypothetical protein
VLLVCMVTLLPSQVMTQSGLAIVSIFHRAGPLPISSMQSPEPWLVTRLHLPSAERWPGQCAVFIVALICIFSVISNVEHFVMCLLSFLCLLWKMST